MFFFVFVFLTKKINIFDQTSIRGPTAVPLGGRGLLVEDTWIRPRVYIYKQGCRNPQRAARGRYRAICKMIIILDQGWKTGPQDPLTSL